MKYDIGIHSIKMYIIQALIIKSYDDKQINPVLFCPIKDVPLYLNGSNGIVSAIARWRLKIGK